MLIIGITGTLGAGKGTIVEFLVKEKGFKHYSVRNYLTKRLIIEGKTVNRNTMVEMANRLRAENGPSYIIEELYSESKRSRKNCVIESIRTEGEISALRSKGNFFLLSVNADPILRYRRIAKRKSETDNVTIEEFLSDEMRELTSTDPNKQNLSRCIELADYKINNSGTIDELNRKVSKIIYEIENGNKERKK